MDFPRYAIRNVSLAPLDESSDAVLIANGEFEAVGSWEEISNAVAVSTPVFDGMGATLLPGIDDSHLHGYMLGRQLTGVDVSPAKCPDLAIIHRELVEYAGKSSGWIRGFGWVSGLVKGSGPEGTPSKVDLAASGIQRPIILTDFSGHQAWCNQAAIEAAGINRHTADPVGGVIVRDSLGEPTGLFLESAVQEITRVIPQPSMQELKHALSIAGKILIANGITSYTDPGIGPGAASLDDGTASLGVIDAYRELTQGGDFAQRVDVMLLFGGLGGTTLDDVRDGLNSFGPPEKRKSNSRITVAQLKVFADGIPRSRTAWMSEPYDNHQHGSLTVAGDSDQERVQTLKDIYQFATGSGWQIGIHATGDESISSLVNIAEATTASSNLRNYLIHADLVKFSDFPRIAASGLSVNMQPSIRWMVGRNVEGIVGAERFKRRSQLRRVKEAGIKLALSSDAPVSPPDWRQILATAMDRSFKTDAEYKDDQALTAKEALIAMTSDAAYQSHAETWRGRIAKGFVADFVLLDSKADFNADPWLLMKAKSRAVCINGRLVHGEL